MAIVYGNSGGSNKLKYEASGSLSSSKSYTYSNSKGGVARVILPAVTCTITIDDNTTFTTPSITGSLAFIEDYHFSKSITIKASSNANYMGYIIHSYI